MVNTSGGRHTGSELCDRSCDEAIEYDSDDELVYDSGRAAIEDRDGQATTNDYPRRVDVERDAAYRKKSILTLQLISMAGRVNYFPLFAHD